MADRKVYCRFCSEEHIVAETLDTEGHAVGLFCRRQQALITAFTTIWNGEDVFTTIERFTRQNVDEVALSRIKTEKMPGLSRKFAYRFLQTQYAKERKLNYYFVQHHILDVIRATRERQFRSKAVI